jgi:hypothetical protein
VEWFYVTKNVEIRRKGHGERLYVTENPKREKKGHVERCT